MPHFLYERECAHSYTVMRHELLIAFANVSEFKIIQAMIFSHFCVRQRRNERYSCSCSHSICRYSRSLVRRVDNILSGFTFPLSSFFARFIKGSLPFAHFTTKLNHVKKSISTCRHRNTVHIHSSSPSCTLHCRTHRFVTKMRKIKEIFHIYFSCLDKWWYQC